MVCMLIIFFIGVIIFCIIYCRYKKSDLTISNNYINESQEEYLLKKEEFAYNDNYNYQLNFQDVI